MMINHIDNNTNYKISNNFNDKVMSKMMTTMTIKTDNKNHDSDDDNSYRGIHKYLVSSVYRFRWAE